MKCGILFSVALGLPAWALGCLHSETKATSLVPPDAAAPNVDAPEPPRETTGTPDASSPDASNLDASSPDASSPAPTPPDMTSAPAYPPSALYEVFSKAEPKLIGCYLPGKKRDPNLRGRVIVKLTINADGSARPVTDEKSNLPDPEVIACVIRTVKTLRFTKPVEGSVMVVYPFIFRSAGDTTLILPDVGKP